MKIVIQPNYFELVADDLFIVCNTKDAQVLDTEKLALVLIRELAKQKSISLPSRGAAQALLDKISEAK
jgi:hypothetical protein